MDDHLKQYRINSNWRHHVLQFIAATKKTPGSPLQSAKNESPSVLEYCDGDAEYARALSLWIEFMQEEEEERFSFFNHFATASIDEAKRSLSLLMSRKDSDPDIRMPLLKDVFTSYSRPFKNSHGRLNKKYRLTEAIGVPSPEKMHKKILNDRDQLYAHCDLSVKQPRVSKFGISLRMAGHYWSDYESLLPIMMTLMDNAMSLIRQYIIREGMDDATAFFQRFEDAEGLSANEPKLLNQLYGMKESNN
jgi:hypothetical protein